MRDYMRYDSKIRFAFPIDGDCVNKYDGYEKDGILYVNVKIEADAESKIEVNQIPMEYDGKYFVGSVPVEYYRTNLVAKDDKGNEEKIVIFKLHNATDIYRVSIDDNILFFRDITKNKDVYTSIFDNPFLAIFKEAHDKYGTPFQFNVHWEACPHDDWYSTEHEYFNLSMMTDKFRDEWIANSDWLRLSFHAGEPHEERPYIDTDMKTVTNVFEAVNREIVRFAGEETLSRHNTTIHWCELSVDGLRALRNRDVRALYADFCLYENGTTRTSYFYPADFVGKHLTNRDFWMDTEEDMLYGNIEFTLNHYEIADIVPKLEELKSNPHISGCIDIVTHEEWYYPDFVNYKPHFKEQIMTVCKWCSENGYKGYFMQDVMEK